MATSNSCFASRIMYDMKLSNLMTNFTIFRVFRWKGCFNWHYSLGNRWSAKWASWKKEGSCFSSCTSTQVYLLYYLDYKYYYYIEKKDKTEGSTILWLYSEVKFQQLKTCVNHASTGVKGKIQLVEEDKIRISEWRNTNLLDNQIQFV